MTIVVKILRTTTIAIVMCSLLAHSSFSASKYIYRCSRCNQNINIILWVVSYVKQITFCGLYVLNASFYEHWSLVVLQNSNKWCARPSLDLKKSNLFQSQCNWTTRNFYCFFNLFFGKKTVLLIIGKSI